MAPAPLPHPGPNPGHVYNVPRAPETYALADAVDATIPPEVRAQFQRDDAGRVLFFTAPPLARPRNGVAEQFAGLGHSARHLASIQQLREERARKRKERDEEERLREEEARKRLASEEGDVEGSAVQRRIEEERKAQAEVLEKVLLEWAADLDRGTEMLGAQLGGLEKWREMMKLSREESRGLTDEEARAGNLRWFYGELVRRGEITEGQRREFEDCFIRRRHLDT